MQVARFREAMLALRSALKACRKDSAPLMWAEIKANLGNLLQTLAEREADMPAKKALLVEAIGHIEEVAADRPRDQMPVEWAKSLLDWASALTTLGEVTGDRGRLDKAVSLFRQALAEEQVKARDEITWARLQNELGNALATIGEHHESGATSLALAVAAYEQALSVRRKERLPDEWAHTAISLASALSHLGERTAEPAPLERARIVAQQARDYFGAAGQTDSERNAIEVSERIAAALKSFTAKRPGP